MANDSTPTEDETGARQNSDSEGSLRPFAAHIQGVGIGLVIGNMAALAHGLHYPVAAVAVVLLTVGYYYDKRSVDTDNDRSGGDGR